MSIVINQITTTFKYLFIWTAYICDGTHMLPQGHSRVYGYVDMDARARYRSCLCHSYTNSTFGGKPCP